MQNGFVPSWRKCGFRVLCVSFGYFRHRENDKSLKTESFAYSSYLRGSPFWAAPGLFVLLRRVFRRRIFDQLFLASFRRFVADNEPVVSGIPRLVVVLIGCG